MVRSIDEWLELAMAKPNDESVRIYCDRVGIGIDSYYKYIKLNQDDNNLIPIIV